MTVSKIKSEKRNFSNIRTKPNKRTIESNDINKIYAFLKFSHKKLIKLKANFRMK